MTLQVEKHQSLSVMVFNTDCSRPLTGEVSVTYNDPFHIQRRIADEIEPGECVGLEVRGPMNSVGTNHLLAIWRACMSKGVDFYAVVFDWSAIRAFQTLGILQLFDIRVCPYGHYINDAWCQAGQTKRCHGCTKRCIAHEGTSCRVQPDDDTTTFRNRNKEIAVPAAFRDQL